MHQYKIFFHLITSFNPLRCPGNLTVTKVEGRRVKKMQPPQDNSCNSPWYGAKNYPLVWIHQDQINFLKKSFRPYRLTGFMSILQKKQTKVHPYGFREQGIQRNEKFKYFWKKVPRLYDFWSDEIHRTKNLFGVALHGGWEGLKIWRVIGSHSPFTNCAFWGAWHYLPCTTEFKQLKSDRSWDRSLQLPLLWLSVPGCRRH